jgi:hypothetical protein
MHNLASDRATAAKLCEWFEFRVAPVETLLRRPAPAPQIAAPEESSPIIYAQIPDSVCDA